MAPAAFEVGGDVSGDKGAEEELAFRAELNQALIQPSYAVNSCLSWET